MWAAVKAFGDLFFDNDEDDDAFLVRLCRKALGRPNFDLYQFPPDIKAQAQA